MYPFLPEPGYELGPFQLHARFETEILFGSCYCEVSLLHELDQAVSAQASADCSWQQCSLPLWLTADVPGYAGLVAIPAAMLQQMLAAHQSRVEAVMKASLGPAPQQQQQPAVKAESMPDTLSAAACLYMPSADLDVSADGVKRPPAA